MEETAVLEAHEFIRRFLFHILPSGFMKIRSYGFLANRHKKENIKLCRSLLGASMETGEKKEETALERIERVFGVDLSKCPSCKGGRMEFKVEFMGPGSLFRSLFISRPVYEDTS